MSRPPARTIQVALGLVERGGRYLICQRPAGKFLGGYWEFPGGKRERRESWEACLRRELREELGIAVRRLSLLGRMRYGYKSQPTAFRVFRGVLAGALPQSREGQQFRWVWPRQLSRYRFPPANRALIAHLAVACYTSNTYSKRRTRR